MRTARLRCAIVLIDDDDRSVQLLARLSRDDSYAVAMTVGAAAAARRRNARMLARLLRNDGWLVDVSVGDWAGVERLTRRPQPDLLLVDVDAQQASALALVRHARALAPSIAVMLVTDRADQLERSVAEVEPCPSVFAKPLDYVALKQAMVTEVRPRTTSEIVPLGSEYPDDAKIQSRR